MITVLASRRDRLLFPPFVGRADEGAIAAGSPVYYHFLTLLYAREAGLKQTLFCVTQYPRKDVSYMALISIDCTQAAKRFCSFGRIIGGAMNAGDTGSTMERSRMASMSAFVAASICQPSISLIGSSWPGCLAPQRAIVGP